MLAAHGGLVDSSLAYLKMSLDCLVSHMNKNLWTYQKGVLCRLDQIEKFVYGIDVKFAQVALRKCPPCLIGLCEKCIENVSL